MKFVKFAHPNKHIHVSKIYVHLVAVCATQKKKIQCSVEHERVKIGLGKWQNEFHWNLFDGIS